MAEIIRVNTDTLEAILRLPSPDSDPLPTLTDVLEALSEADVSYGIMPDAIAEALEKATSGAPPKRIVVARGKPAEPGQDARVDFSFETDTVGGTLLKDSDRMDYRERHTVHNVRAGDVLATKTPSTSGLPGIDLSGNEIPARHGKDIKLLAGKNVTASDDGLTFTAETDGVVALTAAGRIGVFEKYEVPSDVDYSTGNLTVNGTLVISGWIKAGFHVVAEGKITVGGGIENATVKAGSDLLVRGGIIGANAADAIQSGGDIRVRFVDGSRVHADGSIAISDQALRSVVSAGNTITVTGGKGCIRSGLVQALNGLEVNELGSAAEVRTCVTVGTEFAFSKRMAVITRALAGFRRKQAKLDAALGGAPKSVRDDRMSRIMARRAANLRRQRRDLLNHTERLKRYRSKLVERMFKHNDHQPEVIVHRVVHAGTIVVVNGYKCTVRQDTFGKTRFVFDPEKRGVGMVS